MNTELEMNPLKIDLVASTIIGLMAAFFAMFALKNLNINLGFPILLTGFLLACVGGIIVGRLIGDRLPIGYNFLKFGETGGLNWLVDLGVFNILVLMTGITSGIYFAVFKGISFIFASTNSYLWNKFWVFEKGRTGATKEIGKFILATSAGLLFNVLIATLVRTVGPSIISNLNGTVWANIAVIIGSLLAMIFNFALYRFWVFK